MGMHNDVKLDAQQTELEKCAEKNLNPNRCQEDVQKLPDNSKEILSEFAVSSWASALEYEKSIGAAQKKRADSAEKRAAELLEALRKKTAEVDALLLVHSLQDIR